MLANEIKDIVVNLY